MVNVTNVIKGYKLMKQLPQENSLNLKDATLLETIKRNGKKIKIYHLDLGSTPFRVAAAGTKGLGDYYILVDNNYMSLPKEMQEVALLHEIGHIVNGDFDGALYKSIKMLESIGANCTTVQDAYNHYIQLLINLRDINQEYKADAYAVQSTDPGNVVGFLMYLSLSFMSEEIALRYKAVTGEELNRKSLIDEVFGDLIKGKKVIHIDEL